MAQQPMYPGIINSPQTELATAIDDIQTTVEVTDASNLPDGPNLATIGSDETAETIRYTAKSGNELTGVERGFQGTAKAWGLGSKVARLFTAYDHDSARSNIIDLDGRVTEQKAETVTNIVNAKIRGMTGDGTTNDYPSLAAIITSIGSARTTILFVPGTYRISSNITIPSNVTLWFLDGAMLSPDSGVTITINGGIQADVYQIFIGSGLFNGSPRITEVIPQWYGAVGSTGVDSTSALQKSIAFCKATKKPLRLVGTYKITAELVIDFPIDLFGDGYGRSALYTENNIPMLTFDTDLGAIYYGSVRNIGFIGNVSGTRTSNAGILIKGTSAVKNYFNFNTFEDLIFTGVYYGIRSTKSSGEAENRFNWNSFAGLKTANYGAYNVEYGLKFDFGSGTGNVFEGLNMVATTSGIEWGGSGDENIGDITISASQFGGGGSGIKATKGATNYGSNITITGCQWDAGVVYGVNFTNMSGFSIEGCRWGGATSHRFEGCSGYSVTAARNIESAFGNQKFVASNSTTDLFEILFNAAYECAYVEITTFALLQGVGGRITRSTYLLSYDGSGIAVTLVKEDKTGTTGNQINHVTTSNVSPFKISAQLQGANASNTNVYTQLRITGNKYKVTPL